MQWIEGLGLTNATLEEAEMMVQQECDRLPKQYQVRTIGTRVIFVWMFCFANPHRGFDTTPLSLPPPSSSHSLKHTLPTRARR